MTETKRKRCAREKEKTGIHLLIKCDKIILNTYLSAIAAGHQLSVFGHAVGCDGNSRLMAVVVESNRSFPLVVKLEVWVPVECAAVVFGVRQGPLAVVGMVELSLICESRQDEESISICNACGAVSIGY